MLNYFLYFRLRVALPQPSQVCPRPELGTYKRSRALQWKSAKKRLDVDFSRTLGVKTRKFIKIFDKLWSNSKHFVVELRYVREFIAALSDGVSGVHKGKKCVHRTAEDRPHI